MSDHQKVSSAVHVSVMVLLVLQLTACSTHFRQGLHHLQANNYPEALIFFEADAKQGHRASALHVSNLYLLDYQVPRDLSQSRAYLNMALAAKYGRYDQAYDYFIPLIKAYQVLADPELLDKSQAIDMLAYQKYQAYHWPLAILAHANLIGYGLERNLAAAKSYFEQSIDMAYDEDASLFYAWWLVVFPDETFRDPEKALSIIESVSLEDYEEKPLFLDTIAAVYAANGLFDLALDTQRRAVAWLMMRGVRHPQLRNYETDFKARLASYQLNKAWILSKSDLQVCMADALSCMKPMLSLMPDENRMLELQVQDSRVRELEPPRPTLHVIERR